MPKQAVPFSGTLTDHVHGFGALVAALIAIGVCGSAAAGTSLAYLKPVDVHGNVHIHKIMYDLFKPRITGPDLPFPGLVFPGRENGYDYGMGIYYDTNMNYWDEAGHPAVFLGCEGLKQSGRGVVAMFALTMFFLFLAILGHVQHWSGLCESCSMWMACIGHIAMFLCLAAGFVLCVGIFANDWPCDVPNESVTTLGKLGLTDSLVGPLALSYHVNAAGQTVAQLNVGDHFTASYAPWFMLVGCLLALGAGVLASVALCCPCCGSRDAEAEE